MSVVTFSSGVHAGARAAGSMTSAWFSATPTTQFATFSLTSASAPRTGPQGVSGHANLKDAPVEFQVERNARDTLTNNLSLIAVQDMLNGRPRTTLSGWRDAGARSGFLAKVAWSERVNATGALSTPFEVWGVVQVVDASVRGTRENLRVLVWPCDALFFIGTTNWWVTPSAYATLVAEAGS
jgi:hypothetical protein